MNDIPIISHIRRFHFALKDRQLHFILYGAIIFLGGLAAYYHSHPLVVDPYEEDFLNHIGDYEIERSLQLYPETVAPGSVKVPILIYHSVRSHAPGESPTQQFYDVDPQRFEDQLKYLRDNGYAVISLEFLVKALQDDITLPAKSVALTFDDGWRNQFSFAYPLLVKYGYTATFFIVSDYVGGGSFLNWDQIKYMDAQGMSIGAHTRTHPFIPNVRDKDKLWNEIAGSKRILESHLGKKIDLFAYPYGHYSEQAIEDLKNAGFASARTTYKGVYNAASDLYTLKGVEISDDMDAFVAALR